MAQTNLVIGLLMLCAMFTKSHAQMSDYDLQEITISVSEDIKHCELTLIVDDIYYPVKADKISGNTITLSLATYQDYLIILNCDTYINITIDSPDIVDDRDLSISSDTDYEFLNGILKFN